MLRLVTFVFSKEKAEGKMGKEKKYLLLRILKGENFEGLGYERRNLRPPGEKCQADPRFT